MTTNLKEELASLKIDRAARGGGSRPGLWIALIVLLAAAAAGGWYLWNRQPVVEVRTAEAAVRSGAAGAPNAVLNASGYVTARRRATVSSKVTGKVMEIFVEEGKAVKRGQVLARLDDSQLRAIQSVEQAQLAAAQKAAAENEARLKEAELTLGRRQQLVKEKVISKAELDSAEAEVESLTARMDDGFARVRGDIGRLERKLDQFIDLHRRQPQDPDSG